MRLQDIHRQADEAGVKAAESCPSKTSEQMGFAFIKFPLNTPWGLWANSRGMSIRTSKREQVMMIRKYDASMSRKVAYTHAYADFLKQQGIKVVVRIDRGDTMTQRERELAEEKRELFKKFTRADNKLMAACNILQRITKCDTLKEAQTMAQSALRQLPLDHSVEHPLPPSFLLPAVKEPAPSKPTPPLKTQRRSPKVSKINKASLGEFL